MYDYDDYLNPCSNSPRWIYFFVKVKNHLFHQWKLHISIAFKYFIPFVLFYSISVGCASQKDCSMHNIDNILQQYDELEKQEIYIKELIGELHNINKISKFNFESRLKEANSEKIPSEVLYSFDRSELINDLSRIIKMLRERKNVITEKMNNPPREHGYK